MGEDKWLISLVFGLCERTLVDWCSLMLGLCSLLVDWCRLLFVDGCRLLIFECVVVVGIVGVAGGVARRSSRSMLTGETEFRC